VRPLLCLEGPVLVDFRSRFGRLGQDDHTLREDLDETPRTGNRLGPAIGPALDHADPKLGKKRRVPGKDAQVAAGRRTVTLLTFR